MRSQSASSSSRSSQAYSCSRGAGASAIADVRHEDRVVGAFDRSRDGRPDAGELPEGLPLTRDPEAALDLAAELRLLVERGADPPLLDELAVAVQPLVAEVALVQGVVELQRDQLLAGGARVRATQVNAGLFPVFQR